ncbi:MAG: hydrogen peroxide-inducible genes activator [Prevotellaceae bacterium]|jgi:LysR family hydrogen peroxide-inducible transcriptional activator|nr:hydrogen peroxide-inducible genes activator [Prevotellaceae bacterium]
MTLQQLEYLLALDKTRHFVKAAEMCGVTQPTLSAMIQKLEEELDCIVFDRTQHPIGLTAIGRKIIEQASVVLFNSNQLREIVSAEKKQISGSLQMAVIPTVAPYLLPDFIKNFLKNYPSVVLRISEMRTETILDKLRTAEIDIAILATPLNNSSLLEVPLYYEKFLAYVAPTDPLYGSAEVPSLHLPLERMWILQEGHCLRNQVFNFCEDKSQNYETVYEAGSIDTLVKIVDENGGFTVIPELHIELLSDEQRKNLRPLTEPETTREISIVIRSDFVKEGLLNAVAECVKKQIPEHMLDSHLKKFAIKL